VTEAPRAILEIPWGRAAVRKTLIAPGERLTVGRSEPARLVVPHDRQMSGVHFELSWDGARCRIHDLGSARGTWLDGQMVMEGDVESGAFLRAGDTIFMLYIEGATVRRLPADPPELAARKERALAALRAEPAPLFALLDAARDRRALTLLRESVEEVQSLYEGTAGDALADMAPYLVSLPRDAALLERLVREGWGKSWGVYLTSARPFAEVRRHFRRLLLVKAETARLRLYFRFYDPRVLRVFLPVCNVRQREEMFGEIQCFLMEGARGEVLRFTPEGISGGR
jgi:hypothetical protein